MASHNLDKEAICEWILRAEDEASVRDALKYLDSLERKPRKTLCKFLIERSNGEYWQLTGPGSLSRRIRAVNPESHLSLEVKAVLEYVDAYDRFSHYIQCANGSHSSSPKFDLATRKSAIESFIKRYDEHGGKSEAWALFLGHLAAWIDRRDAALRYGELMRKSDQFLADMRREEGMRTYLHTLPRSLSKAEYSWWHSGSSSMNLFRLPALDKPIILLSADGIYFKALKDLLLLHVAAFPHVEFHVVLVARAGEAEDLRRFAESQIGANDPKRRFRNLSMSLLCVENVTDQKALAAAARYIVLPWLLPQAKPGIYVSDLDMVFHDNPIEIMKIMGGRIGVVRARGLMAVVPWRRIMAGTLYCPNNRCAQTYSEEVQRYVIAGILEKRAWYLDQNALNFGYEMMIERGAGDSIRDVRNRDRVARSTNLSKALLEGGR